MYNKLTLKLLPQDLRIITHVMGTILTGSDLKELKSTRVYDYMLFAAIHDFFNKSSAKAREMAAFGIKTDLKIKITMKRHEALAFFLITDDSESETDSLLPALPDYTMNLIRGIRGEIHQTFLV